jgi:hypothetical protein
MGSVGNIVVTILGVAVINILLRGGRGKALDAQALNDLRGCASRFDPAKLPIAPKGNMRRPASGSDWEWTKSFRMRSDPQEGGMRSVICGRNGGCLAGAPAPAQTAQPESALKLVGASDPAAGIIVIPRPRHDLAEPRGAFSLRRPRSEGGPKEGTTMLKTIIAIAVMFSVSATDAFAQSPLVKTILEGCKPDIKKFCSQVAPGSGRIKACMKTHLAELSEPCKEAIFEGKLNKM